MKSDQSGMDVGEELRQQAHVKRVADDLKDHKEYHEMRARVLGCSPELSALIAYLVKRGVI